MKIELSFPFLLLLIVGAIGFEAAAQPTVVNAGSYVDVDRGRLISPATIVVEEGVITAINPRSTPRGARVIDLGDRTLLPGLIDTHTHVTMDIGPDMMVRRFTDSNADDALRGAYNARLTLEAGFTTIRNVGGRGFADVDLAEAINRGWLPGPDIHAAGHSISITGGHCDATGLAPGIAERGPEQGVADGPDGVLRAVRYQIKHGAKVIKICATAGVLSFEESFGAQQMTDEEMRVAVEEAARHDMKVAAHAHGAEGIRAAVEAGVASIEHGSAITTEIGRMMKERGTYLVPTTYLVDAIDLEILPPLLRKKAETILPIARRNLRRAISEGVPIAFGTDSAVYPHGDNAKELGVLVDLGMSPAEALRSATVNAADLMGLEDRGRISTGLRADLIAVSGNPLENVRVTESVDWVMKRGTIYKDATSEGRD